MNGLTWTVSHHFTSENGTFRKKLLDRLEIEDESNTFPNLKVEAKTQFLKCSEIQKELDESVE